MATKSSGKKTAASREKSSAKKSSPARKSSPAKKSARKYSPSSHKNVEKEVSKLKQGTLKSGSGKKVKSRKQAVAIGLSEARRSGKKVPTQEC